MDFADTLMKELNKAALPPVAPSLDVLWCFLLCDGTQPSTG